MSSRGSALADVRDDAMAMASRLGWACLDAAVDLRVGTAKLCFIHQSGRVATLSVATSGATSLTREQREIHTAVIGRRGDRALVDRISTRLIGREMYGDATEGLRALAHYLADNSAPRMSAPVPCETFADSGTTRPRDGAAHRVVRVCLTCRWSDEAHNDETRAVLRGEHPESMRLHDGSFARRPIFGSPHRRGN